MRSMNKLTLVGQIFGILAASQAFAQDYPSFFRCVWRIRCREDVGPPVNWDKMVAEEVSAAVEGNRSTSKFSGRSAWRLTESKSLVGEVLFELGVFATGVHAEEFAA